MKWNKILALVTLCALAVPSGFAVAAEPLVTDVAVKGSVNGTSGVTNQISLVQQTVEDADKGYLANIKSNEVAYAQLSWNQAEDTEITAAPEGVAKDKFFAVADNKEVTLSAAKAAQTEVHKIKFNYVPQVKQAAESQRTIVIGKAFTLDLNEIFEDKDGDTMTFAYQKADERDRVAIEGTQFTYTPDKIGTENITFYAEDAGVKADSSVSGALFRMTINVQNDALISSLSFSYPGVDSVALSPRFESNTDQYVLNIPDDIPYVVPSYAAGEAEKCYIGENNNVNSVPTNQKSFVITYKEGIFEKHYTFTFNRLPKYVGEDTIHVEQGETVTIPLSELFTDADGDALTVTASTVEGAQVQEGNWVFTPVAGSSVKEVTFTANDGKGSTAKKVAINTIVMDATMLRSLSIGTAQAQDGTYETKPFTTAFLPNQYAYVFEITGATSYGKVTLEKAGEETEVSMRLQKNTTSSNPVEVDTPFEIPVRDNATLIITVTDKSENPAAAKTYRVLFNRPPVFYDTFPDKIEGIATGQELSLQYEALIADGDSARIPAFTAYDTATGNALGTLKTDEDEKKVWVYTPAADGTVNVKFIITDAEGSKAEKIVPITAVKDTQAPVWGGDKIVVRTTGNTTAEVRWPRPTDNDVDINGAGNIPNIKSYTIYYRKPGAIKQGSVTVSAGKNIERRVTVKDLNPGQRYEFYVTAEDRSGNVSEPSGLTQVTMPAGSSNMGGNTGGGTSGGYTPITPTTPTPTPTPNVPSSGGNFTDMTQEYAWAQTAVTALANAGVVNGTGDGMFSPGAEVTRADFLVMLFRALGIQHDAADNFSDVPAGSYYYQTVGMAKAMGIAAGAGDNMFYPEQSITREEMITLTYRTLQQLGKLSATSGGQSFGDLAQVSEYAVQPVLMLSANGIIAGDENGNVNPAANTQRSEAAVMIYRIWSNR